MVRKLSKCCEDKVRELLVDIGTAMGECEFDSDIYWAFRKEWLGDEIPKYIKTRK